MLRSICLAISDYLILQSENGNEFKYQLLRKHDHKRNKVTREFHVELLVTVKIPRIDRASTDFRRMPALVCKVTTHGDKSNGDRMHHLLTSYGTLNDHYRTEDLKPLVGGVVDAVKKDYLKRKE